MDIIKSDSSANFYWNPLNANGTANLIIESGGEKKVYMTTYDIAVAIDEMNRAIATSYENNWRLTRKCQHYRRNHAEYLKERRKRGNEGR